MMRRSEAPIAFADSTKGMPRRPMTMERRTREGLMPLRTPGGRARGGAADRLCRLDEGHAPQADDDGAEDARGVDAVEDAERKGEGHGGTAVDGEKRDEDDQVGQEADHLD